MKLSVRALHHVDLQEVLRIEQECFPSAWTSTEFQRFLAMDGVRAFVVAYRRLTCGFCVIELESQRLRVLNLAVDPVFRRRGVALFLLGKIEALAKAQGRSRIELEVRETNLAAQLLYRKAGYRAVEILREHYGNEDGYLMRRELPSSKAS